MGAKSDMNICEKHSREEYKLLIKALPNDTTGDVMREEIKKIMARVKNNTISVKYNYKLKGKNGAKYGRVYADGLCYQTMKSELRGHMCNKTYNGFDLHNAHPQLLNDLFKYYKVECNEMDEYVNNRVKVLEENNITKSFVNTICNTEKFTIKAQEGFDHEFFQRIHDKLYDKLYPLLKEDQPELYELCRNSKMSKNKKVCNSDELYNIGGCFIANYLMTIENKMIIACRDYLMSVGFSVDSIIHDEILVRKDKSFDDEICESLKNVIKNTKVFGYNWDFTMSFKNAKYEDSEYLTNAKNRYNAEVVADPSKAKRDAEGEDFQLGDKDVAKMILEEHKDEIFNFNGCTYLYFKNIWIKDVDLVLRQWCSTCTINVYPDSDCERLVYNMTGVHWSHFIIHMKCLIIDIPDDCKKGSLLDSERNVAPFSDGYFDFLEMKFVRYSDSDRLLYFTFRIERPMPIDVPVESINKMREIFLDMFRDADEMDEAFSFWCRSISGNYSDKLILAVTGGRNSGKSLIGDAFKLSFIRACGSINSDEFIKKSGGYESAERKNGFLIDMTNNLLCISQEAKSDMKFDGTILKTTASGGDMIKGRACHERLVEGKIRCLYTLMCQKLPVIEPADAKQNMLLLPMPNIYIHESEYEKAKAENQWIRYKIADDNVKTMFGDFDVQEAFIMFVFSFFKRERPSYTILKGFAVASDEANGIAKDEAGMLSECFSEFYELTGDHSDRVKTKSVNTTLSSYCATLTADRVYDFLKFQGCTKIKSSCMYYTGLKEKFIM